MSINKNVKVDYAVEIPQTFWDHIARYISIIFLPPLTLLYALVIVAPFLDVSSKWSWSGLFVLLFMALPILFVYTLMKKGVIKDLYIKNRKERLKPALVVMLNTLFGISILHILEGPKLHIIISFCGLLAGMLILLVTLYWKISIHSSAVSGLFFPTVSHLSELAVPCALLIALVAWSRIQLNHHTMLQTFAGIFVGVLSFGVPFYLMGLV